MDFTVTGATADDSGPAGCVARFLLASAAGDADAATREVHPDALDGWSPAGGTPPGVTSAEIGEPEPREDGVQVPTRMTGPGGEEQRFVFVVRPVDDRWGIDFKASMEATFGGDPLQMMEDALRSAVQPLGEAMAGMGEAIGGAFDGASGGASDAGPPARRIAIDEPLPDSAGTVPESVVAHVTALELRRRIERSDPSEDFSPVAELTVRCHLDLDPSWSANACTGVTVAVATSVEGEDLRPQDAGDDLGSENYASWERERRDFYFKLPLAAPQQAFSGLAELAGVVRLDAVGGEPLEIVLGPVADLLGRTVHLAAFGVDVAFERDGDGCLIVRAPSGWLNRLTALVPVGANGETLGESWSTSGDGETDTRTYQSEVPDDGSFLVRFWAQSGTLSLDLRVEGLPVRF